MRRAHWTDIQRRPPAIPGRCARAALDERRAPALARALLLHRTSPCHHERIRAPLCNSDDLQKPHQLAYASSSAALLTKIIRMMGMPNRALAAAELTARGGPGRPPADEDEDSTLGADDAALDSLELAAAVEAGAAGVEVMSAEVAAAGLVGGGAALDDAADEAAVEATAAEVAAEDSAGAGEDAAELTAGSADEAAVDEPAADASAVEAAVICSSDVS